MNNLGNFFCRRVASRDFDHDGILENSIRQFLDVVGIGRGEQKILSSALLLAQFEVLAELGELPLLLLDDLASEFDEDHYRRVLDKALKYGGQVWVSGTSDDSSATNKKVFHVKHGAVEEVL